MASAARKRGFLDGGDNLRRLPIEASDADLLRAVDEGQPGAANRFFDRHSNQVRRVLFRVLGNDPEIDDLVQEVFARAFANLSHVESADSIRAWLSSIAVFAAREVIRKRQRHRWLLEVLPRRQAQESVPPPDDATLIELKATYRLLDKLPADERITFALRFIDGMEQATMAEVLRVSIPTIKRRIKAAEARFLKLARRDPVVRAAIEEGSRWP